MNILAIETATEACSVALKVNGEVRQRLDRTPRGHARHLLPWVQALLAESGLGLQQLDAIAFGRGPGSFTSLRIGIGVVQGLAFGGGLGVIPISSLRALAQSAHTDCGLDHALVAIDARMQQVYSAAYSVDEYGLMQPRRAESVIDPENLICPDGERWAAVGNGFQVYQERLPAKLQQRIGSVFADIWPTAAALIALAAGREILPPDQALPRYIRDQVAAPMAKE